MTDLRKFLYHSGYETDRVAGYYTGSITVAGYGSVIDQPVAHGLKFTPLGIMRWSNDPTFTSSFDENGVQTAFISNVFSSTDATNVYFSIVSALATTATFYFRVLFIMPFDVNITVPPTAVGLDKFLFNTSYNYSKILIQNKTSSNTATIAHNLNYYPQVEAWYIRSDGRCFHLVSGDTKASYSGPRAEVTTTSLILTSIGTLPTVSNWYYRIYADGI